MMRKWTSVSVAVGLFAALPSSSAVADKLSEFKDADRYDEGCVTIPVTYSSERNSCTSEGPKVHEWCDGGKGPVSCGSHEETKRIYRDIETAERRISDLKDKRARAENNRSSAQSDEDKRKYEDEIKQIANDLYEAEKKLRRREGGAGSSKEAC